MSGIGYKVVKTQSYDGQKPGTSGLRKKVCMTEVIAASLLLRHTESVDHMFACVFAGQGVPARALFAEFCAIDF